MYIYYLLCYVPVEWTQKKQPAFCNKYCNNACRPQKCNQHFAIKVRGET